MKNMKMLVIGFAAGAACMLTTSVIAANTDVTAKLSNDILFKINGTVVGSPSDQPVLNYNDRVYVPIRFVAEQLNCEVNWDIPSRQVVVESPEPEVKIVEKEVIKEVPVYVDKDDAPDGEVVYSKLPVKKNTSDYKIEITGISRKESDKSTKVFVSIENKGEYPIQLVQRDSVFVVDGEEIEMNSLYNSWDMNWYNDIQPDDTYEGYLNFEIIPEDYDKMDLTLTIRTNGETDTDNRDETFHFTEN